MCVTSRLSWLSGYPSSILYSPVSRLNKEDSEGFWEGGAPRWAEPEFLNHHMEGHPITRSTNVKLLSAQETNIYYISLTFGTSFVIAYNITLNNTLPKVMKWVGWDATKIFLSAPYSSHHTSLFQDVKGNRIWTQARISILESRRAFGWNRAYPKSLRKLSLMEAVQKSKC